MAGPGNLQPGVIPLRAIGIGGVLEGAFKTLRRYPRQTIGMAVATNMIVAALTLVAMGPAGFRLVQMGSKGDTLAAGFGDELLTALGTAFVGVFVVAILSLFVLAVQQLIFAAVTSQAVLGRKLTLRQAWAMAKPRIWPAVGAGFVTTLMGLIFLAVYITIAVVVVSSLGDDRGKILFGILFFVAGFALLMLLVGFVSLTPAVVALENVGPIQAITRTIQLTLKGFWRVMFGVFVVAFIAQFIGGVIQQILGFLLQIPLIFAGAGADTGGGDAQAASTMFVVITIIAVAVQTLVSSVTGAFAACGLVLVYFDTRMRYEGLDVTLLREVHEAENQTKT